MGTDGIFSGARFRFSVEVMAVNVLVGIVAVLGCVGAVSSELEAIPVLSAPDLS